MMRVLLGPPPRAIMRHFQSTYELIYTIRRRTIISQLRAIYSHTTKSSLIMKRDIEELFKAWGLFTHPLNPRLPLAARLMGNDICGISAHCRMANGEQLTTNTNILAFSSDRKWIQFSVLILLWNVIHELILFKRLSVGEFQV